MTAPNPQIELKLSLPADQATLLAGLEAWLALGLITDQQVRSLSQAQLSCPLPVRPGPAFLPAPEPVRPGRRPWRSGQQAAATRETASRPPAAVNTWLQQLMGELSVVWLLGLGVFLIVLSSAVLAATQWAQFSAIGQYLVLGVYTSAFWAIGRWSARSPRLQLTAKTLQTVALLLLPLNVWAIDALGVAGTPLGLVTALGAMALLAAIGWWGLSRWSASDGQKLAFGALAGLHLGWATAWVPIAAVYAGAAVSAAIATLKPRSQSSAVGPLGLLVFSLGLLLLRALGLLERGQWGQLGLAFGLYGATLVGLSQGVNQAEAARPTGPLRRWSGWGGRALLWWGWLLSLSQWTLQALGVSSLGLGLRLRQLQRTGRRWDLLAAFAIALQLPFLLWDLLPPPLRASLLSPLTQLTQTADRPDLLLGIALFPYVVLMVAVADAYHRRQNRPLARFSEALGLGLSSGLTTFSLLSPKVLVLNLIASSLTALIITCRRQPLRPWRVYATHLLALLTVFVTIGDRWPALDSISWIYVVLALMTVELLLGRRRTQLWPQSAWRVGQLLAVLGYGLLLSQLADAGYQSWLGLLGLSLPLLLLLGRGYGASLLALGLTAPLTLGLPETRLLGLGLAALLAAANSYYVPQLPVAMLSLGFGLGGLVSLLHDGWPGGQGGGLLPGPTYWYLVGAIAVLGLWSLGRWLPVEGPLEPAESPSAASSAAEQRLWTRLSTLYGQASDRWATLLSGTVLLGLTIESGLRLSQLRPAYGPYAAALVLLAIAIGWRSWGRPQPAAIYSLGWSAELLAIEGIGGQGGGLLALSAATLALGGLTLLLSLALRSRQPALVSPLLHLTLLYALLALGLRANSLNAWTGWLVLAAALMVLEVGRQRQLPWLRWLAFGGISWGWYELVVYQLLQASGEHPADGLVLLAAVALVIMLAYRLLAPWLEQWLGLPRPELVWVAHIHWGIGSGLLLLSAASAWAAGLGLPWLALAVGLALVSYALVQGRLPAAPPVQSRWVILGLLELIGWIAYARLAFAALQSLDRWWAVVACALAVGLYWLPWPRWGWPLQHWRQMAVGLPLAVLLLTGAADHIPSLCFVAGFYGWLAGSSRRVRLSYLTLGLLAWAAWLWLDLRSINDSVAQVAPAVLSLLYIAQVDPALQAEPNRNGRHWLRLVGSGLLLLVALLSPRWTGLPLAGLSLGAIALGLLWRTRAFLYSGTLFFGLNAIYQLVLLNATYPFVKWVIGIVVGVALIWVAADFERRRDQWIDLTQGWVQELDRWA